MAAAVNDFRAAIGRRGQDGTYPLESMTGYQGKHYPWPTAGQKDIKERDRSELVGVIEEMSWKIAQIVRMGEAIDKKQAVKADMSVLRLHETEKLF